MADLVSTAMVVLVVSLFWFGKAYLKPRPKKHPKQWWDQGG
jgi:hypothetical protein